MQLSVCVCVVMVVCVTITTAKPASDSEAAREFLQLLKRVVGSKDEGYTTAKPHKKSSEPHKYYFGQRYDTRQQDTTGTAGRASARQASCGTSMHAPDLSARPGRIYGGSQAVPYSWPWQVSVRELSEGEYWNNCGGSILAPGWIVMAAHCFDDGIKPDLTEYHIVAGDFDADYGHDSAEEQLLHPAQIHIHPGWHAASPDSDSHDIAIIELDGEYQFNDKVQPVCLSSQVVQPGTLCWATGWGVTEGGNNQNLLKQVAQTVWSDGDCSQVDTNFDNTMLCAGYGGPPTAGYGTCEGDSGGPMVCQEGSRWVLQGITSFGLETVCGEGDPMPSFYNRVAAHIDFLRGIMGDEIDDVLVE